MKSCFSLRSIDVGRSLLSTEAALSFLAFIALLSPFVSFVGIGGGLSFFFKLRTGLLSPGDKKSSSLSNDDDENLCGDEEPSFFPNDGENLCGLRLFSLDDGLLL